ncbi:hypothetical protein BJX68DRAFT_276023 [Aspergillus pseudodeflectus]|uniref:Zn(2)-C6 fungal-type domain-containing protein n=1 Tax=Aspergillus pseudodeflectus TaxID=176178 RepID=A0ABR4KAK1_9EURO
MARRTHRKSRNGCLECKRRHVKCDERQPICSNCIASERVCEYGSRFLSANPRSPFPGPGPQPQAQAQPQAHSVPTTPGSGAGISPHRQSPDQGPSASSLSASSGFSDQPVNMLHIELFQNLCTRTLETFDPTRSTPWLTDIVGQSVTSSPYLVNELLAFSALHMSTTRPPIQRAFYRYHAAQLQTHALAIYKEMNPPVTHETCVPLFVFAAVLGIHMLCDTLIYRDDNEEQGPHTGENRGCNNGSHPSDFRAFLTRFVHFFRLYHGVRAIIGESWHFIQDTPLAPHFKYNMDLYKLPGRLGLGPGCAKLLGLVERANLGNDLTKTYKQAIESLQACLNVIDGSTSASTSIPPSSASPGSDSPRRDPMHQHDAAINGITTWPLLLDIEFGDLLEQGRPEALVILAHYGMLLHRFRDSSLFGDSGRFVVQGVTRFLGQGCGWEEWLEWPNEVVSR